MGARRRYSGWVSAVREVAADRGLSYERIGSLNPKDGPEALCPGGANRLVGELAPGFWGASCDAEQRRAGVFGGPRLPGAVIVKSHLPELGERVGRFDVESIETTVEDTIQRRSRLRVRFESIEFNRRYIATVPGDHDPVKLRELFSPGFLDWANSIDRQIDFGASEGKLYVMWRLTELSRPELEGALDAAGELAGRLGRELAEAGGITEPGPWNAGLAPFPAQPGAGEASS